MKESMRQGERNGLSGEIKFNWDLKRDYESHR